MRQTSLRTPKIALEVNSTSASRSSRVYCRLLDDLKVGESHIITSRVPFSRARMLLTVCRPRMFSARFLAISAGEAAWLGGAGSVTRMKMTTSSEIRGIIEGNFPLTRFVSCREETTVTETFLMEQARHHRHKTLMDPSAVEVPPSISSVLEQALHSGRAITVGELFDRLGERGFGLLMIVIGLPMFIPIFPPGSSTVIGAIYALLAVQLFLGLDRPWLPQRVRRVQLSERVLRNLRERGLPLVRWLERFSRRRFHVLNHPVMVRVAALIIFVMGVVLASPAPFVNVLPTIALMLIAFGLLNDDGFFLLAGMVLAAGVLIVLGTAVRLTIEFIREMIPRIFR